MQGLIDFIRARLDEDEAAAQAANDGKLHTVEISFEPLEGHMLRWHPTRVLAEVAAKRAILAAHHPVDPCDAHDGVTMQTEPCDTLLALALPYGDHPDYREEWRP